MVLTEIQKDLLERTVRRPTAKKRTVERARIVLLFSSGLALKRIAREYNLNVLTVRKWVRRWKKASCDLLTIEKSIPLAENQSKAEKDYRSAILSVFDDASRPGKPPTFSAEQIVQIVGLACEVLDDSDECVSSWTQEEIAREAEKRGIVSSISQRTVCRFLKASRDQAS